MSALVAAAACLCAFGVFVATGLERSDVRKTMEIFRGEAVLVVAAAHSVIDSAIAWVRGAFGVDNSAQVSLGEVSEMIDVVRLGLSAGLSFDAALEIFCANRRSTLTVRLERACMAWQVGVGAREDELLAAAQDLDVRALETFAITVGQALALGAPLAETLAVQSREIRAAHRAAVEREIERAPVKLLIPTGTLILPALLLSILGPLLGAGGMM
ncbi:type II secretion system F family protein [Collinsella sp. LCP19S3_B11]|uniref:type II secretion system F family protein n=1 Tax=Collinsella sp. LCP19S3_B11 TaxID=3438754 RepID=UPI003F914B20